MIRAIVLFAVTCCVAGQVYFDATYQDPMCTKFESGVFLSAPTNCTGTPQTGYGNTVCKGNQAVLQEQCDSTCTTCSFVYPVPTACQAYGAANFTEGCSSVAPPDFGASIANVFYSDTACSIVADGSAVGNGVCVGAAGSYSSLTFDAGQVNILTSCTDPACTVGCVKYSEPANVCHTLGTTSFQVVYMASAGHSAAPARAADPAALDALRAFNGRLSADLKSRAGRRA